MNKKTGFDSFFDEQMMDDEFREGYEKVRSEIAIMDKEIDLRVEVILALQLLHNAGLVAQESKLKPGGIIGGLRLVETEYGDCFEEAFMIHRCNETYYVTILCDGYGFYNEPFSSIEDAVKHIINVYQELDLNEP